MTSVNAGSRDSGSTTLTVFVSPQGNSIDQLVLHHAEEGRQVPLVRDLKEIQKLVLMIKEILLVSMFKGYLSGVDEVCFQIQILNVTALFKLDTSPTYLEYVPDCYPLRYPATQNHP